MRCVHLLYKLLQHINTNTLMCGVCVCVCMGVDGCRWIGVCTYVWVGIDVGVGMRGGYVVL